MKTIHHSYGIIPTLVQGEKIMVLCVKNSKSGEWGYPKGTPEKNETPLQTAKRELREETGIENILISDYGILNEKYSFLQNEILHSKTNTYWIGLVENMDLNKTLLDEIDEIKWIDIEKVSEIFKFDNLIKLSECLKNKIKNFPLISNYNSLSGETYQFEFYESDNFDHLPIEQISQSCVFAFHKNNLLIVNNINKPGEYGPVMGSIEKGENPDEALHRELKEESNMKIIDFKLIGYQKAICLERPNDLPHYQMRYVAKVEPLGPFTPECDPDGDVTELLVIDPVDYKKYFDWGEIGDHIMNKAIEWINKNKML